MDQFLSILGLVGGLGLLLVGAEVLVRHARLIGLGLGLRPMIVGATIVAFGTSAPEFLVSLVAAIGGEPGLAMGNLIGSNISNIALVLGATAIIRPVPIQRALLGNEYLTAALATASVPLFMHWSGFFHPEGKDRTLFIDRFEGALLCLGFALFFCTYLAHARRLARADRAAAIIEEAKQVVGPSTYLLALGGLAMLLVGSNLVVETAGHLATELGVEPSIVGASVLAIGTSLPELATTVVAAIRGDHDIAIGNVLGSNVFNLLFVLGPVSAIHPMAVSKTDADVLMPLMLGVTIVLGFMLRYGSRITRIEGVCLLLIFAGFLVLLIRQH